MNLEALMAKIAETKKSFVKNEKPFSPKIGETKFVLLAGWNPAHEEVFWREFGGHYVRDRGGKVVAFYPCDEVINGQPCPICNALRQAADSCHDDATLDLIKQARASRQYLVNAIVIGENNNNPIVMSLSKSAFEQLINVIGAWGQVVFDKNNPQLLQITRTGTGFETKYLASVLPERFTLPHDIYSKIKDLDKYVDQRTDQLQQKALNAVSNLTGIAYSAPHSAPAVAQIASAPTQQVAPQTVASAPAKPAPAAPAPAPASEPIDQFPMDSDMSALMDELDQL